jgi:hypothetical protein
LESLFLFLKFFVLVILEAIIIKKVSKEAQAMHKSKKQRKIQKTS